MSKTDEEELISFHPEGEEIFRLKADVYGIGDIAFNQDGTSITYRPKEDITNWEMAMLFPLFMSIVFSGNINYDFMGYIVKHNLTRHFEIKK